MGLDLVGGEEVGLDLRDGRVSFTKYPDMISRCQLLYREKTRK